MLAKLFMKGYHYIIIWDPWSKHFIFLANLKDYRRKRRRNIELEKDSIENLTFFLFKWFQILFNSFQIQKQFFSSPCVLLPIFIPTIVLRNKKKVLKIIMRKKWNIMIIKKMFRINIILHFIRKYEQNLFFDLYKKNYRWFIRNCIEIGIKIRMTLRIIR